MRLRSESCNVRGSSASGGNPATRNVIEMFAETLEHIALLAMNHFAFDFAEREMHDVVVVDFLAGEMVAQFKPDLVQQVNLFRGHPRRMRAEVENLFLARRRE